MSSFWQGRRVLVTGHTGFKGAWLTLWLHALGAEVTGFSGPPPTTPSLFELARVGELCRDVRGDVRDRAAVAEAALGTEVVFHLAAQAIVRTALEDPDATHAINVSGTENLLAAVGDTPVVCVTSDKAYAAGPGPHVEGDPLGGAGDPYSASKAAQERVAAAHDGRVATARAGNVIGGGDWGRDRLLPDLVRARESGAPVVLRHPDAVRPWQHVLGPLAGYLLLAERLTESGEWASAWNFGPAAEDARPVGWVVDRIRERWELDVRVDPPGDGVEAPVLRLDASAARSRLGWEPRYDLATGLDATVFWHDQVRAGHDARAVTLTQIEDAS